MPTFSAMRTLSQKQRRLHLLALGMGVIGLLFLLGLPAAAVLLCPCSNTRTFLVAMLFPCGLGWGIAALAVMKRAPSDQEILCEYRGAVIALMALKHRAAREELYECVGPIDPQGGPSGSLGLRCRYPGSCLRHWLRRKYLRLEPDAVPAGPDQ